MDNNFSNPSKKKLKLKLKLKPKPKPQTPVPTSIHPRNTKELFQQTQDKER